MTTTQTARLGKTQRQAVVQNAALVVAGTLLLALSAKVLVPFWPVPMTMQTLVVLLMGAHYGPRLAAATIVAYLMEGALGLPVFSTGAGLAYLAGPTGGYLVGFLASAVAVGFAVERGVANTLISALAVFLIGDAIILGLGVSWLSALIGPEKALTAGLLPFLPAEGLKIALATAAWVLVQKRKA